MGQTAEKQEQPERDGAQPERFRNTLAAIDGDGVDVTDGLEAVALEAAAVTAHLRMTRMSSSTSITETETETVFIILILITKIVIMIAIIIAIMIIIITAKTTTITTTTITNARSSSTTTITTTATDTSQPNARLHPYQRHRQGQQIQR